jgi:hypothetical protein
MARVRKERELKRSRITVIGEGLTERWYFEHLRSLKGFRYDCKPRFFAHQSYEEMSKLIDWVIQNGGIAVCVCDADVTRTNEERKKAFIEMKASYSKTDRVFICDSMPSIEFWFLIHYLNTSRNFKDSDAVIQVLQKYIPEYEKSGSFLEKAQWVSEMSSDARLSDACKRAARLGPENESYSEIHKAIRLFSETTPKDH